MLAAGRPCLYTKLPMPLHQCAGPRSAGARASPACGILLGHLSTHYTVPSSHDITHPPHPCAPVRSGQGLAFGEPKLAAGTRAVLPRLRVLCVDECGNPTATLPAGVTGLEARSRLREVGSGVLWRLERAMCAVLTSGPNARGSRSKECMRAPLESQPLAFGSSPASAACGAPGTQRAWPAAEGCWQQRRACLRCLFIH